MSLDDHSHCNTCVKAKCSQGCAMVMCQQDCGAAFHWCKSVEHVLLCQRLRVPCINQAYGSPQEVRRSEMGEHLATCPASVVSCPYEWNRWPVYSNERNPVSPVLRKNFHAQSDQLDVALAIRDQNQLMESLKVSSKLRKSLKDNLNQRSPAVPLVFRHNSIQVYQKMGEGVLGVDDTALGGSMEEPECLWPTDFAEKTSLDPSCPNNSKCHDVPLESITKEEVNSTQSDPTSNEISQKDNSSANLESQTETTIKDAHDLDNNIPPPPDPPSMTLFNLLSLDLNVESITRYQAKPRSMYTFLCAQVFRRDKYPWHVKNVHAELFTGLNGWIQHRCPLSVYGCNFSVTRLCPNNSGSRVVFSPVLESFGVQPEKEQVGDIINSPTNNSIDSQAGKSESLTLIDLPFEVLVKITKFLDGFSLNNLALTCTTLEGICYSVLKSEGIVTLQWEKTNEEGKPQWKRKGMVWLFPNDITPIEKWTTGDLFSMSTHIRQCPYYDPVVKTEPVQVVYSFSEDDRLPHSVRNSDPFLQRLLAAGSAS